MSDDAELARLGIDDRAYSDAIVRGDLALVGRLFATLGSKHWIFGWNTPLAIAVEHNQREVVSLLLGLGADPNEVDPSEPDVPLVRALDLIADCHSNGVANGPNGEVVSMLLAAGADVNLIAFNGHSARSYVARCFPSKLRAKFVGRFPALG